MLAAPAGRIYDDAPQQNANPLGIRPAGMINWQDLLATLGSATIIVGASAWVAKSAINHWLSRSLDGHREALARESEREMTRLRHELELIASERSTTFTQLHTKRSDVVGGLYQRLVAAQEAVELFIDPRFKSTDPDSEKRYNRAFSALRDVYQFFRCNRIYFDVDLCRKLDTLFKSLHRPAWGGAFFHEFPDADDTAKEVEARRVAWTAFRDEVPPIMADVEADFRRLLGVQSETPSPVKQRPAHRMLDPQQVAAYAREQAGASDA